MKSQTFDAIRKNLPVIIIGAGILVRVAYFLADTAFWRDEVYLALNIRDRSFGELMTQLDYDQTAPLAFLFLQKAVYELAGSNALALRFPSLLCAIASLPLFYLLMRKLDSPRVSSFALALFAISPPLIRYGGEMKPYSADVLATLLCTLSGLFVLSSGFQRRALAQFAAIGCVAIWCSNPIVFVLFGVGLTLMGNELCKRNYKSFQGMIVVSLLWLTSFFIYFKCIAYQTLRNDALASHWSFAYPPLYPTSYAELLQIIQMAADSLMYIFFNPMLMMVLLLLGIVSLCLSGERGAVVAWSMVLAVLSTFVAAGFHLYPFSGRLLLFLVPLTVVPASWAAANLDVLKVRKSITAAIVLCFLLAGPIQGIITLFATKRSDARELCEYLESAVEPDDAIYVHNMGEVTFDWYASNLRIDPRRVFYFYPTNERIVLRNRQRTDWDANQVSSHHRVWIVFPEVHTVQTVNERNMLLNQIVERKGPPIHRHQRGSAEAYLFASSGRDDANSGPRE